MAYIVRMTTAPPGSASKATAFPKARSAASASQFPAPIRMSSTRSSKPKKGGLYRSDDGGVNWTLINDDHRFRQRAWYFTHVWADPKNVNGVYIANTGLYASIDGGKTFASP